MPLDYATLRSLLANDLTESLIRIALISTSRSFEALCL